MDAGPPQWWRARFITNVMFDIRPVAVVLAVLAVWRVTHLIVEEDGPWDLLVGVRKLGTAIGLGRLLTCFYCASVWIAIPFTLLIANDWRSIVICIPALSGGAILLERFTDHRGEAPAIWTEEEEKS